MQFGANRMIGAPFGLSGCGSLGRDEAAQHQRGVEHADQDEQRKFELEQHLFLRPPCARGSVKGGFARKVNARKG